MGFEPHDVVLAPKTSIVFSRQTSDRVSKNFPPILHCHKFQYLPPPRRQRAGNTNVLAGNIISARTQPSPPVNIKPPRPNFQRRTHFRSQNARVSPALQARDHGQNTRLNCPQMGLPMTHENRSAGERTNTRACARTPSM